MKMDTKNRKDSYQRSRASSIDKLNDLKARVNPKMVRKSRDSSLE